MENLASKNIREPRALNTVRRHNICKEEIKVTRYFNKVRFISTYNSSALSFEKILGHSHVYAYCV